MLRDVQLGGHVFDDAAETSRDEEHLHVTLVQRIHELPGERQDNAITTTTTQLLLFERAVEAFHILT